MNESEQVEPEVLSEETPPAEPEKPPPLNLPELFDWQFDDGLETCFEKIEAKMNINNMKEALSDWVLGHAEELSLELPNIAPHGDYSKLIEDNDGMTNFLKTEVYKLENWKLTSVKNSDITPSQLIAFGFRNKAVDDGGEGFAGYVYANKESMIRHAFVVVED
jgi:hypothetical protein